MYRGQARLVQKNPQIKWAFWGVSGGILLLTLVAVILLPAHLKRIAAYIGAAAMVTLYPAALSRSAKPSWSPSI